MFSYSTTLQQTSVVLHVVPTMCTQARAICAYRNLKQTRTSGSGIEKE